MTSSTSTSPVLKWANLHARIPCVPPGLDSCAAVTKWGTSPGRTDMERQAAAFLVEVWTGCAAPDVHDGLPKFDAMAVAARGDEGFREAVALFVVSPFWP